MVGFLRHLLDHFTVPSNFSQKQIVGSSDV